MFKKLLIQQAGISNGHRVLDLGCGTATLTIMIKKTYPQAQVVGLDADPVILSIAKAKAKKESLDITFENAMAYRLPFPDESFDRVVSSLMIHHLTTDNKTLAFKEVYRVLRNGGEFHLADFGAPTTFMMKLVSLIVRHLEETSDNIRGHIPEMLREAGFVNLKESMNLSTMFGTMTLSKTKKDILR